MYLLDDPLAAVDAHVANHLFSHCIMGHLRTKTRVLCTHHVRFLYNADLVLVMDGGRVVLSGPPSEILPQIQDTLVTGGVQGRHGDENIPLLDDEPQVFAACVFACLFMTSLYRILST